MVDRYRLDKFFRTLVKSNFKFTRTVKSEFISLNDFEKEEVYKFLKENNKKENVKEFVKKIYIEKYFEDRNLWIDNFVFDISKVKFIEIDESRYEKIYVTTDIHGCFNLFMKLLRKIRLRKTRDLLIIMGDSCDKGVKSYELYKKYIDLISEGYEIIHIFGNHEDMLYKSMTNEDMRKHWIDKNSGIDTEISFFNNINKVKRGYNKWFKENKITFTSTVSWFKNYLELMPDIVVGKENIFVHSFYNDELSLENQSKRDLMWERRKEFSHNYTNKNIYFGHTPNKEGKIISYPYSYYNLDTGCYITKVLACIEIKTKKEIYVKI